MYTDENMSLSQNKLFKYLTAVIHFYYYFRYIMIRLQSDTIHYLTEEVVNAFSNVSIISKSQESIKLNPLILAALKSPLFKVSPH